MAKTLRIPTRDWYPRKYIKRAGEDYVYVGELPNDPICRKSHRDQAKEQGRKVVFTVDRDKSTNCIQYVSRNFHRELWREGVHLFWGKDRLV